MKLKIYHVRKISFAVVTLLCLLLVSVELVHRYNYGHFFSYGLHVDVLSRDASIGIPGQTKLYWAELSNYSVLPVTLTACDYHTDTLARETEYPYTVQRWDALSGRWQNVIEMSGPDFCYPIPLSRGDTHIVSRRLWPGQSVQVMDWEATGTREPFQKGDLARFVVFRKVRKVTDWHDAIPSAPFPIEDQVERNEVNYRVKH